MLSQEEVGESFFISEEEAGERLDKILAYRLSKVGSRTYFQYLINEQKVLVNGAPVQKRVKPRVNDEVEVEYILTPELSLRPENIPLNIVYEDEAILVINKAQGMVVHPAPGNWSGTFVNALLFHCQKNYPNPESLSMRPGIVHRLDKDTSGLLIAAKTSLAQQRLIEMFAGRRVHKEYLAICLHNPGKGKIDLPIARHPVHRQQMAISMEKGRSAITHFQTIAFDGKISLVSVIILTGRTHQIRVHLKHRGTPVLGDPLYGSSQMNEKYQAGRQMLHAHRLHFNHPISGESLAFEAVPPADMQSFIRAIEKAR